MNAPRSFIPVIADCILCVILFLFFWLWWNPAIYYQYAFCWQTAYAGLHDLRFLTDLPLYPGKLIEYPAAIMLDGFAVPWLGAAIVTAVAVAVSWLTGRIITHCGAPDMRGLKYLPAIAILLQFVYYTHLLIDSLSVIAALALTLAYLRARQLRAGLRIGIFAFFAAALYLCATHAYVIFAVPCIIIELGGNRGYGAACMELLISALLPAIIVGAFFPMMGTASAYVPRLLLFGQSSSSPSLYLRMTGVPNAVLHYSLFFIVPCIAAISIVAEKLAAMRKSAPRKRPPAGHAAYAGIVLSVIIGAGMTLAYIRCNPGFPSRHNAVINYAVETDNWEMLLREAPKMPLRHFTAFHYFMVNRALYHAGKLLSDLFRFPQGPAVLVLNTEDKALGPPIPKYSWACLAYYELGKLALAEHCALESQHLTHNPGTLRLLASLYALKGLPEASRNCCNVLRESPLYRQWARGHLDSLAANPQQVRDMEARRLQSSRQMAFEFKVANYLVWCELDSIAASVAAFREFNYPALPRLCQEALLLREIIKREKSDLHGYSISSETIESFNAFGSALKSAGIGEDGHATGTARFRDSYFDYYLNESRFKNGDENANSGR